MQPASGSPLWQTVFLSFACVLILFEVVRGWRLGLMRQLIRAVAIAAAYASAIFGGKFLLPMLRPFLKVPDIVIVAIGGAILAFIVYFVIATVGAILFKRTGQQSPGAVRFLYGICGAIAGIFFGLFSVWLVVIGIRSLGAIAEANVQAHAAHKAASLSRTTHQISAPTEPPIAETMAKLKRSIELGPVGQVVRGADIVPVSTYETLGKVGNVFSNPQSAERFLSYPGAKELTENPKIVALRDDPEIIRMIQEGRLLDLLHDSRIIDAVNDPALANGLKSFQFQSALDYATKPNRSRPSQY
jgi:Colicin V production protein